MNTRMTLPMSKGLISKKVVYVGELGNEKDMEDDDLPPDLLRLVEQDERKISSKAERKETAPTGP